MITRHNYEELFLLYLDNELSPTDRLSVESFVKENTDLQEELEAFRQCRLIPEDESSFGSAQPLLNIAAAGRWLPLAGTYRMTRIAAAALLLLLTSLAVFIAMKKNSSSQNIQPSNTLSSNNVASLIKPTSTQTPSSAPHVVSSTTQTGAAAPHRIAKKIQPAVTPGAHGALYLTTTHQQQDRNESPKEQVPDKVLAGTRISVQTRVTTIDPANTRTPEKIFVADNNEEQPVQPYLQSTGSSGTSLAVQTAQQDPSSESPDGFSEQVPAGKNKLGGVFRKISRVLEKATAQNDNDRHAILIGNLQIAFK